MKVLKFGGSSVGTPAVILNIKKIVESESGPLIVVVSALGGITDLLLSTALQAAGGDDSYHNSVRTLVERHH